MNGNDQGIRFLQWSYPLLLWILVAFFALLAVKNVVATASWKPDSGVVRVANVLSLSRVSIERPVETVFVAEPVLMASASLSQ